VNAMVLETIGVGAEVGGLALDVADRGYGTARKIYNTRGDKIQFQAILALSCKRGGIEDPTVAERVGKAIGDELVDASKESGTWIKSAKWHFRIDRGPGVDSLTTAELYSWLDGLYTRAKDKEAIIDVPELFRVHFDSVLGDSFTRKLPPAMTVYARKLLNTLHRNDRQQSDYFATKAVVLGSLAATGVGGAFFDGAHGAVDTDLKTALAIIAGTTLTALLATFTREIERWMATRRAVARNGDDPPRALE
jgi:hypothetical protein